MENRKSWLEKLAPKKFCCRCELKNGCKYVGIILAVVMAACTVETVIQSWELLGCKGCPYTSWKRAYGYSISTAVYCGLMCFINLWFVWAVVKEKKSVVLAWVVISAVWLTQTSCLLVVLLIMHHDDVDHVTWAVSLVFGILLILLLCYFVLAAYGYWLQLRSKLRLPGIPQIPIKI